MKAKKGISLIVLVITIIVIIILAGAVILNLTQNNPMDSARIAKVTQERESLESAILLYSQKVMANTQGEYSSKQILTGEAIKTAAGPGGIPAATYYGAVVDDTTTLVTGLEVYPFVTDAKTLIDIAPSTGYGAGKWGVEVGSGKCWLVFDTINDLPDWMKTGNAYKDNSTLASFVKVVNETVNP